MYRQFACARGWAAPSRRTPVRRREGAVALRVLRYALLSVAGLALAAAPAAAAPVAFAQAQQGTLAGWSVRAISDPSASTGSAVRYDGEGSVQVTMTLPADADTITLRVRGDQCAGAPEYTLAVDKADVAQDTAASTSWTERSYSLPLLAGTHSIAIQYTNDHSQLWPDACDRNLYLDAVTVAASGAATPETAAVPAGFVHQSGTQLLDGAGRPLRLRGVNVGGWLAWEGWIWGSGFDYIGESAMLHNLANLVGPDAAEQFRSDVRTNFITDGDFRAMAAYGLNSARVPFNYRLLEDDAQPFTYKQSGWDVLDRVVAAAKRNNVYLVLDLHAAPCGQNSGFTSDYVGPDLLWTSATCLDRTVALWKAIAARYADENIIAGYDLLNEGVAGDAGLLGLYKRLTTAIRQVDRNHTLIYEGNYMAREFGMFTVPLDDNEMLAFHDYPWMVPGQDITARIPAYEAAARRVNAPIWAGEFGQSTSADLQKYVDLFDGDPLIAGWAQWTWKQSPGFPALQTIQHTPASKKLIEWMNNPSRPQPTATEAAQGMSDFIRAIRFENTLHDATLRQVLTRRVAPATLAPGDSSSPAPGRAAKTAVRRRAPVRVRHRRAVQKRRHAGRSRPAAVRRSGRKVSRPSAKKRSTRRARR